MQHTDRGLSHIQKLFSVLTIVLQDLVTSIQFVLFFGNLFFYFLAIVVVDFSLK